MFRRSMATTTHYAWKDVPYTAQRHAKQTLDIAVPSKRLVGDKLPTCVFVHGGSWQRGDKAGILNNGIEDAIVPTGCAGVSVNYRLSPEVMHPEHTRDIASAVQWLHTNIETFGGDPSNLVLVGHSAGAHLVMQVLADPQYLAQVGVDPAIVKGVVGISGVYNVVRLANAPFYGPLTVNPVFGERVDQWREGSITTVLTRQGEKSPLYRTPTLLLNAEDDAHLAEDAQELKTWLEEGGNTRVEIDLILNRNHFSIIRELATNPEDETMLRIRQFLKDIQVGRDRGTEQP